MSKKKRNKSYSEDIKQDEIIEEEEVNHMPQKNDYIDPYSDTLEETDNKRWELDEDPQIAKIRMELKKRVNSKGVEEITGWLRMALGKNVALSNLNEIEINRFTHNETKEFVKEIANKQKDWGCRREDRGPITRWIERTIYLQMKRAYKDGERRYRSDSYGYNEHYKHDEVRNDEIGRGGISWYNPFSGKKEKQEELIEDEYR